MEKGIVTKFLTLISMFCLISCTSTLLNVPSSSKVTPTNNTTGSLWQGTPTEIWHTLQPNSRQKLLNLRANTKDPVELGWINLALISKQNQANSTAFINAIIDWKTHYPSHPANSLLTNDETLRSLQTISPHQIAILLPQQGAFASSGQSIREGFLNAYYANAGKVGKQTVKFYDTSTSQDMYALYEQAKAEGADMVVGPLTKEQVQQLETVNQFTVPVIALNYLNNTLPNNFYEFGLLPEDEVSQIATHAYAAGLHRALIFAPQNTWGKRLAMAFINQWQALHGDIQNTWYFSPNSNFDQAVTQFLQTADNPFNETEASQNFDVIFLFAQPAEARKIIAALQHHQINHVPIYASASAASASLLINNNNLNNVLVCDIPRITGKLTDNRLYAVGQDAYLLSQALPRLTQLPNFPLYGATGALTLSPTHQIHRRIPCMAITHAL